jgi:prevent-host-death family protein
MSGTWRLREALNEFDQVVEKAVHDGPQRITIRGEDVAVVLSVEDYDRMRGGKQSLSEFLQASPLRGVDLGSCSRRGKTSRA